NTQIRIDFDATEGRMIFVRHPEHAGFDWAVLDACGRAGASGATVSRDREYARLLFARGFAVADRHRRMLFDDVEDACFCEVRHVRNINIPPSFAQTRS